MPAPKSNRAQCPECEQSIEVASARLGLQFPCPKCDTLLEVIETDPIELDWAEGDYFDDDDDDFGDYEEYDDYEDYDDNDDY